MQEYIEFFQQNMILCLVWGGLLVMLIMNIIKAKTAAYTEINTAMVTQLLNREDGIVVDIRSQDDFKKGHITDAVNILPSDIKEGNLSAIEKYKSTPVIVVCKTGQTAQDSGNLLAKAGFEKVFVLRSGIAAWNEASMPLIRSKK